ncbi:hypothetical protein YTPLAS18_04670 [Nitrospira sp.]|nr:hypothetical protein YTPLAS18_04670 [Nitrospira sp.]
MTPTTPEAWIDDVRTALESQGRRPLIEFLQRQRWFAGKGRPLVDVRVLDALDLSTDNERRCVALVGVEYRGQASERYAMPLLLCPAQGQEEALHIVPWPSTSEPSHQAWLCDASRDTRTWKHLYAAIGQNRELLGQAGCLIGRTFSQGREELAKPVGDVAVLSVEQSNTSVVFDGRAILKWIRKWDAGINPDSEMLEFLTTRTTCPHVPQLWGLMMYEHGPEETDQPATTAVVQQFVPNSGDGWKFTLAHLDSLWEEAGPATARSHDELVAGLTDSCAPYLQDVHRLGSITADLHVALASISDIDAFRPERITMDDIDHWQGLMEEQADAVCRDLRSLEMDQLRAAGMSSDEIPSWRTAARNTFAALAELSRHATSKIRHHGDFHLGQVLKTRDGFVIIDFEGEPARPLEERRAKTCPLKDVAGMLRSFNYAIHTAWRQRTRSSEPQWAAEWERAVREAFLTGYQTVAKPGIASFLPRTWDQALHVIRAYELDKVFYELRYELRHRPQWLAIPAAGIRALLS